MGMMGKSGSGKSTLVRTLVGLKKADKGKIDFYINNQKTSLNNNIGYSSQGNSLFPYLTLEENIMTFGKLRGLKKQIILERMDILLKQLKLTKAKKKKTIQLSGGMAKRADIIITLLHNPYVIFLDEPFSGLDFSLVKFLWKILHNLAKQGKIIIISSHLLGDIKDNCTNLGLISEGNFYNYQQIVAKMKKDKVSSLEQLFMEV